MQTFTFELFEGTFKSHDQVNENLQYILAYIAIIQHQIRKNLCFIVSKGMPDLSLNIDISSSSTYYYYKALPKAGYKDRIS